MVSKILGILYLRIPTERLIYHYLSFSNNQISLLAEIELPASVGPHGGHTDWIYNKTKFFLPNTVFPLLSDQHITGVDDDLQNVLASISLLCSALYLRADPNEKQWSHLT